METHSFGAWLQQRRNLLRLTQKEVGAAALCSAAMIRKIEADERQPSPELGYLLADALQIPQTQREVFVEVARGERPLAVLQMGIEAEAREERHIPLIDSRPPQSEVGERAERTAPPHNLPSQLTPFIGREQELAILAGLMSQENGRLISIVGPGGMGKTRLALAYAKKFIESQPANSFLFSDGVHFIDLTPLSDGEHIVPTLAERINFPLQGGKQDERTPQQQILDYLREKQMLLIMDNFEHVLAGAELISNILQTATGVYIMVTSRERLKLQREQVYPIRGLEYPDWKIPDDTATYTAVRLFLQSAQRNQPAFQVTDSGNLTHLAKICRLVAGMPLAIELAAAWVDTLSLVEIATEIQTNLDFLETEMRDMPERHRSIRAVIDTSWQKLTPDEQSLFAQLSIFRGGFTRRAGQTITTASLRLLSRLVAKSFLQYNQEQERYQLHELMRQYGAEKLATDEALATAVRQQHSRYYCRALAERITDLQGRRQKEAIAEIELDIENARAAWMWAARNRDADLLNQALFSLFRFYEWNGRYLDYESSMNEAVDSLNQPQASPMQQAVLVKLLHLKFTQTRSLAEKESLLGQTQALLNQLAQTESVVTDIQPEDEFYQGQLQMEEGNYQQAERSLRNSLATYQRSGKQWQEVNVWCVLSRWAAQQGEYGQADEYGQQALALARQLGDRRQMATALHELGFSANSQGRFGQMRHHMKEALEIAQDLGQLPMQGLMLMEIGTSYVTVGAPAEAITYHQRGLAILRQAGDWQRVAWSMQMLAWDYLALEDTVTSEYWLQEAEAPTRNLQNVRTLAYYLVVCCWLALVQGRHDEALLYAEEAAMAVKGSGGGVDVLANVLTTLGWVQLAHQQWQRAEKTLYEALLTKNVFTRDALLPIAYLLVRRRPTKELVKRAWQLIGLSDQASLFIRWSLFTAFVERFQPSELSELALEEIEATKAYGRSLNPNTVIADLLEELPKLGWET